MIKKQGRRELGLAAAASRLMMAACCVLALGGCTPEQLRENQQGWREAECDKILSTPQRERCLREARGSSEESRKP